MNMLSILTLCKSKLLTLTNQFPEFREENINLPNEVFVRSGKSLWIDLSLIPKGESINTETESILHFNIVFRVNVSKNTGYSHLSEAADRIASLWSLGDSDRAGFIVDNKQVFIRGTEQHPISFSDNVCGIEVVITADCFE